VTETEMTKMSLFIAKFILLKQVACQLPLLLLVLGHQAFMHRTDEQISVRVFELTILPSSEFELSNDSRQLAVGSWQF
jgi:hypothetical protein